MSVHRGHRDFVLLMMFYAVMYVGVGLYVNSKDIQNTGYHNLDTEGMSQKEIDNAMRR